MRARSSYGRGLGFESRTPLGTLLRAYEPPVNRSDLRSICARACGTAEIGGEIPGDERGPRTPEAPERVPGPPSRKPARFPLPTACLSNPPRPPEGHVSSPFWLFTPGVRASQARSHKIWWLTGRSGTTGCASMTFRIPRRSRDRGASRDPTASGFATPRIQRADAFRTGFGLGEAREAHADPLRNPVPDVESDQQRGDRLDDSRVRERPAIHAAQTRNESA